MPIVIRQMTRTATLGLIPIAALLTVIGIAIGILVALEATRVMATTLYGVGANVSADFFRVLGVAPALGRLISAETLREGNQAAVVSYGFWKRMLEGRTNLEGTSLRFANRSFAVIGVLPPETEFPAGIDVWVPSDTLNRFHIVGKTTYTHASSPVGRQQQLVSIARAMIANPKLILADEATGNLHSSQGQEIMEMFKTLSARGGRQSFK
jgi:hypothetical protein